MTERPPNVLCCLTDQERYDYTAPAGPAVETPTYDRLTREGMRFDQAITPISICTSARASLLTGQFPHGHGMVNNSHEADAIRATLPADVETFSAVLADAGYTCTYTGKWHVDRERGPGGVGFTYLGGSDRHHDDIDEAFRRYRRDLGYPVDETEFSEAVYTHGDEGTFVAAKTPVPVEATRAYFIAERTIDTIEAHATGASLEPVGHSQEGKTSPTDAAAGTPFFHRADFYGPHHPYVVPEPYASMYDPDEIDPPASYAETFAGKPAVHERFLEYRGVAGFDWPVWAEVIAKYRGFVTMIDEQVGRVLDALDEHGLAGETLVVHTADHGDFVGGHRQFNKGPLMYDDTYRIPLQVRWPGVVEPETTCEAPVHLHDLAPTFCDVADVAIPASFHGRSLRPMLEDSGDVPADWPAPAFAQYYGEEFGLYTQRMVRTPDYKFVYNGPDRNELYDLRGDPAELTNLIDHPDYADQRVRLERELTDWMRRVDDPYAAWIPKTFAG